MGDRRHRCVAVGFAARLPRRSTSPPTPSFGAILGVAIGLIAFRWFTPNDVFPVTYRRGKAAHLDVGGRRGEAIATAVKDQLGYRGDRGEAGRAGGIGRIDALAHARRTTRASDEERYLFAKLYAKNHVRADRWYKLGRTILYGKLEDETPFQTVRRFVEYEDYTLRLMDDVGLPVPRALRDRRDHAGARVHDRDGVLRRTPSRSATPRSTTT